MNEPSQDGTVNATEATKPTKKKKRSWLVIIVAVVIVLIVHAAIRMWLEADAINKLSAEMPGVNQSKVTFTPSTRIVNATTGCSLILPQHWVPLERPDKPVSYIGPTLNNSTPSIQLMSEPRKGTLEHYIEMSLQEMKLLFKEFQLLDQQTFLNAQGVPGKRVIIHRQGSSRKLQHRYYFFPQDEHTVLILCATASDVFGNDLCDAFDACAKSVEMKK